MKKNLIIFKLYITLLFITGCSPKINEHFMHTKYITNYNIHVINDSLLLYFKTPADITHTTNKAELKKIIKKSNFKLKDSILVYGKTNDPPYEYFVAIAKNNKHKYPKNILVFDTLVNNKTIRFIGNSLASGSEKSLEIDLKKIVKSVQADSNYRKDMVTVMDIVNDNQHSNKYFSVLNEINKVPVYNKQEEWLKLQMQLTYASFLGNNEFYTEYLNQLESRFKPNDTISNLIQQNIKTDLKVVDIITQSAKKHKIVMINENHYYPNHRLLVSELLVKLKEIGYTHLALEALNTKQDSVLNLPNTYPTLNTGFYTIEQNYSNLIREAKNLGYEFVAYESTDNTKNREVEQAKNLYNKTFKLNPNSKVLVLAGIDHILEKPTANGKKWMATVFKENYNIEPLTISQTHLNLYRNKVDNIGIINSAVFNNYTLNSVDFLVLNNKNIVNTKATHYFIYKNNTNKNVQVALFYASEITSTNDYHKKTPYFTTLLKENETYNLPIKQGENIYLYTFNETGEVVDKQTIPTH